MQLAQPSHPDPDELAQYNLGKLTDEETAQIEEHVAQCEECARTVVGMPGDTFLELLRRKDVPITQATELLGPAVSDRDGREQVTQSPHSGATKLSDESVRRVLELPAELRQHSRYQIQECLGVGGMGSVYKAQHRIMNRPVALKVINPQLLNHPGAAQRFHREVQAAARLSHPNIVTAHDADEAGGLHFLVMEYVEGVNLHQVIQERGALPIDDACEYIRQAALGLQHAHQQGMVHRDIKPHNLMLVAKGSGDSGQGSAIWTPVVKILDFGLANFVSDMAVEELGEGANERPASEAHLTRLGSMMGTPDYIAPEQACDAHSVDIRADIYSLGCTLYCLLAGKAPFHEGTVFDKIRAHSEEEAVPLSTIRDNVPAEVEAIVRKMMAKNPAERFQTPVEVAEALQRFIDARIEESLRQHGIGDSPTPRKPQTPSDSDRWPVNIALLVGLACAVLAVFAGVLIYLMTDDGMLVIESDDPRVQIAIDQQGKRISIVGDERAKEPQRVTLRVGEYDLKIIDSPSEMVLSENKVVIRRGGEKTVQVRFVPKEKVAAADSNAPSPFFESLGDLQAIVRKTLTDEGFTLRKVNTPENPAPAGARRERVLAGEVIGDQADESKIFSALSNKLRNLASAADAFVGDLQRSRQDGVDRYDMTYTTATREGTIRLERSPLGADKRQPKIQTWSLTVRVEEWSRTNAKASPPQAASGDDPDDMPLVAAMPGHTGAIVDLAYSADGKWIASASNDHLVLVWNADTHKIAATHLHREQLAAVAFSPDSRWLVTGTVNGEITLRELNQVVGKKGPTETTLDKELLHLHDLAFSPDGEYILCCGAGAGDKRKLAAYRNTGRWNSPKSIQYADTTPLRKLAVWPGPASFVTAVSARGEAVTWNYVEGKGREQDEHAPANLDQKTGVAIGLLGDGDKQVVGNAAGELWFRDDRGVEKDRRIELPMAIYSLAVVPGGKYVIVGGSERGGQSGIATTASALALVEIESGKYSFLPEAKEHKGVIRAMEISPDGRRLVTTAGWQYSAVRWLQTGDNAIRMWQVPKSAMPGGTFLDVVTRLQGHSRAVDGLACHPDGKRAVSYSGQAGEVRMWDIETGETLWTARTGASSAGTGAAAISADGTLVAIGSHDGEIHLISEDGKLKGSWKSHESGIVSIAFSPDGLWLAAVNMKEGPAKVWEVATKKLISTRDDGPDALAVAFTGDGLYMFTGGRAFMTRRIEVDSKGVKGFAGAGSSGDLPVHSVAATKDGLLAAYGRSNGTIILQPRTGSVEKGNISYFSVTNRVTRPLHQGPVTALAFTSDGRYLISGSVPDPKLRSELAQASLIVWDVATRQPVIQQQAKSSIFQRLSLSSDGRTLLTASSTAADNDHRVHVWRLTESVWPATSTATANDILLDGKFSGHTSGIKALRFLGEDKQFLSIGGDKTLRKWNLATREAQVTDLGDRGSIGDADISLAGDLAAITSPRIGATLVWDAAAGKVITTISDPAQYPERVMVTRDGTRILLSGTSGVAVLRDAKTGAELQQLRMREPRIGGAALSSDGSHVLLATGREARLLRSDNGRLVRGYGLFSQSESCAAAFSSDGTRFAVGHTDGTISLWNATNQDPLNELNRSTEYWYKDGKRIDRALESVGHRVTHLWDPLESTCRHASLSIL